MKPKDELFRLIRSLTKSEKRFFTLSSSLQTGEKNYMRLFNFISKQKEYDEEAVKKEFKDHGFINRLPSEKNYLYQLILKSLRGFHSENSVNSQLKKEIHNVEILYEKVLYKECGKVIRRAKKLAYAHEKFYYLIELIKWEKMLLEEEYQQGRFEKKLDLLITEEKDVIEKLRNLAEYMILYSRINYVFRKGGYARNDHERKIVEDISGYHLIKGKNTALSRRAAATCYYIQGLCAVVNYDYTGSFEKFSKVVSIFEQNPALIQDIPKQYIKSLNNLMFCYIDHNNYQSFSEIIEKLRSLRNQPGFSSTDIQLNIFTSTYNAELIAYERFGMFDQGLKLVDPILIQMEEYKDKLSKEQIHIFYYNIAYVYFGAGNFKSALHLLNKILNNSEPNLRQDIYSFSLLFNMVVHYELGNYDLLNYLIKSTSLYFKKRKTKLNRAYKFETVFLKYINRLARHAGSKRNINETYAEFHKELDTVFTDDYERVVLNYFDFSTWVQSKIEGKTFSELKGENHPIPGKLK